MEKKTMGSFLAALRRASGMTQKELAERLNVSDKSVSRWERDDGAPDLSLIPVIAEVFGVTCDELLRGERAAAGEEQGAQSTPKGEQQKKHLLAASLSRFRSRCCISLACSFGASSYSWAKNASASSGESSSMSCSKTRCSSAERLFHAASNSCSLAALTKASISFFMVHPPLAAKSGFSKSMGFRESKNRPVATNFQFLKILAPLGQLLVGACLPQTLLHNIDHDRSTTDL